MDSPHSIERRPCGGNGGGGNDRKGGVPVKNQCHVRLTTNSKDTTTMENGKE